MIKKGKQILVLIVSKEVLVGVLIFAKSKFMTIDLDLYSLSYSLPQVYQCCNSKSNNSGFTESLKYLKPLSPVLEILKLKGGNELTEEVMENLINSVRAKTPQSSQKEISINKFLKRILQVIEPVIPDQRFWRILSELGKPIKSQLSGSSEIRSTDILASSNQKKTQPKTTSKRLFIFVEALIVPEPKKRHNLLLPTTNTPIEDRFSNGLATSELSGNHDKLPENVQLIEKLTRLRRAEPRYSSEVLGKYFQYSQEQLEIKAQSHLQKDYEVSSEGITKNEQGLSYKALIEDLLQTPDLIVQEHGTMNHQESATIFLDPDSTLFASFENNPLYENHHFITSYKIHKDAVNEFIKTGNIGESPETREAKIDQDQRFKAIQKQIQV
jgi:hypothetical protein